MEKQQWSLLNAARNGAIFGLLFSFYTFYKEGIPIGSSHWAIIVGTFAGALIGGVIMSVIGAGVRNMIVKLASR